ncbi:MAG: iron-containing alcohol dehydrogenase, partial [Planctomycetales bacterium]|nr:iron-containing alcohol dehydrogenase [Planctomycetales bacterium]
CGDKKASFRIAVLDPELTQTQPPIVTALTGIDALAHAAETYVTKHKNWISLHFSREAWRLLVSSLSKVITAPDDLDSRGGMQLGACFAGLAIENSMLGATHALANPLTANFNVVHGQAIATMLPHVVRFNGEANPDPYAELLALVPTAKIPGETSPKGHAAVESLATHIAGLVRMAGLDRTLEELGVTRESLPQLADEASKQWTATFNPRPVTSADLMLLYERAYSRANGH